jgi:hypothetical protein
MTTARLLHIKLSNPSEQILLNGDVSLASGTNLILAQYSVLLKTGHALKQVCVRSPIFSSSVIHSTALNSGDITLAVDNGFALVQASPHRVVESVPNIPSSVLFELFDGNGTAVTAGQLEVIHLWFHYIPAV